MKKSDVIRKNSRVVVRPERPGLKTKLGKVLDTGTLDGFKTYLVRLDTDESNEDTLWCDETQVLAVR